jgi:plasmid stabilization system protein ParE
MAFRVDLTAQAELDLDQILEWLLAQQGGDAGLRWFRRLREALASLSEFPHRCPLAPEMRRFPLRCASSCMGGSHISIVRCLPSKAMRSSYFTSATAAVCR